MKIVINLTKREVKHLASPHTFYDCCKEAEDVLMKVQKRIDARYTPSKRRMTKREKKFLSRLSQEKSGGKND